MSLPSPPSLHSQYVVSMCLWLAGKSYSPNQSGNSCPDLAEISRELSKIQINFYRGRPQSTEEIFSQSISLTYIWQMVMSSTNYIPTKALKLKLQDLKRDISIAWFQCFFSQGDSVGHQLWQPPHIWDGVLRFPPLLDSPADMLRDIVNVDENRVHFS